jgi:hypothetical protein
MKEKSKKSKYHKMQVALATLIEVAGDTKEAKKQLDIFIKEATKYKDEMTAQGLSEVLQRDFHHRLAIANQQGNKEILAGTAMGYSMLLQASKIW